MKKVVWITGASSGIGEALAIEMANRGYAVALLARRTERLDAIVKKIGPDNAIAITADVNSEEELRSAVDITLQKFGRIDFAVANAGFGVAGEFESLTAEDYRRQFETNIMGVIHTAYAVVPELKKTKGNFSIVGSVSGYLTVPGTTPYSMSKYAVRALAEGLWFEFKKWGVCVTLISPGFVKSEIRQVDNLGKFRAGRRTGWSRLHIETPRAARIIANALEKRAREVKVTFHGKVLIFATKFLAPLVRLTIGFGLKGRTPIQKEKD